MSVANYWHDRKPLNLPISDTPDISVVVWPTSMSESKVLSLPAGQHSFYGLASITILSGKPVVMGAELSDGYSTDLFAPIYTLPVQFDSQTEFSMRVDPIPHDVVTPDELRFYFPSHIPEGFNEVARGLFHSPIIRGPSFPAPTLKFIDGFTGRKPAVVFVTGPKGSGKTTMSRYIVNRVLSKHDSVCLLDIDPGQPSLSLPGTISRTIFRDFWLNPPEHSSKMAQEVRFIGTVKPDSNIEFYLECVRDLVMSMSRDTFVIVNSFGWVKDLGFEIHKKLIEMMNPEITIVLHGKGEVPADLNKRIFRSECAPRPGVFSISAKAHRELRIASYFMRDTTDICCETPLEVDMRDIRIGFVNADVDPRESLTAICGAVVALCRDDRPFPRAQTKVSLIRNVPPMPCVGFALVRAIDRKSGRLYLITDCEGEAFNTILCGTIQTPRTVYADTLRADAMYLGIGLLDRAGASTDPLILKQAPAGE